MNELTPLFTLARDMDSSRYRWAALALIGAVTFLRLAYLVWWCPLDLAPDEAHYWEWSRRLDWCYYSKGPLVAWLIRLSCEVFGASAWAVRVPAVACNSLLLLGLFELTRKSHRSDHLAIGVVGLALTLPVLNAGALLMTIDAPFVCAWMWALVFAHRAVFDKKSWAWWAGGACLVLGVLAKHTMILWVPSFALFLLATPGMRALFRTPGPWCMVCIGAAGGVPILWWNMNNGWVSLIHTQSHAGFEDGAAFHWLGPVRYLGLQSAILMGLWFVLWIAAMWAHRPGRATRPEFAFLWWMSAPTFVFFGLFAFTNGGGGANWPIVSYLSGMVLAASWIVQKQKDRETRRQGDKERESGLYPRLPVSLSRSLLVSLSAFGVLGLLISAALHTPIQMQPILMQIAGPVSEQHPLPMRRVDPTSRLRGWRFLASAVDAERATLRSRGIEPILATERWTQASELAFYCEDRPSVYCLGVLCRDRSSQYDLWRPNPIRDPARFEGRTFVLVGADVKDFLQAFDSLESTRTITYRENDMPIAEWKIAVGHGYRGAAVLAKINPR